MENKLDEFLSFVGSEKWLENTNADSNWKEYEIFLLPFEDDIPLQEKNNGRYFTRDDPNFKVRVIEEGSCYAYKLTFKIWDKNQPIKKIKKAIKVIKEVKNNILSIIGSSSKIFILNINGKDVTVNDWEHQLKHITRLNPWNDFWIFPEPNFDNEGRWIYNEFDGMTPITFLKDLKRDILNPFNIKIQKENIIEVKNIKSEYIKNKEELKLIEYKDGYKVVNFKNNKLFSASLIHNPQEYEVGKPSVRRQGYGSLAVFETVVQAKYFIDGLWGTRGRIYKIYTCRYIKSKEFCFYTPHNLYMDYLPMGTKFADVVILEKEVD